MICKHCRAEIHQVENHPSGRKVWGDGTYIVCDFKGLQHHEPEIALEETIAGLQAIIDDLQ